MFVFSSPCGRRGLAALTGALLRGRGGSRVLGTEHLDALRVQGVGVNPVVAPSETGGGTVGRGGRVVAETVLRHHRNGPMILAFPKGLWDTGGGLAVSSLLR